MTLSKAEVIERLRRARRVHTERSTAEPIQADRVYNRGMADGLWVAIEELDSFAVKLLRSDDLNSMPAGKIKIFF